MTQVAPRKNPDVGERTATLTFLAKDAASGPVKKIDAALDDLGGQVKKNSGLMGVLGAATGGLINPATLAAGAGAALTGALIGAAKAAIDDEESVNRLGASLKANVPHWDGNIAAIEENISAAQRLAFSDEDLRDSLTVLVGATRDVTKAQNIQAVAMDLARFKGIDLRTASEALIKVEGGHYRSLAQLGIKLREGATSTEALAAVQKVAAGQAQAFGDTTTGAMEGAQIAFGEVVEQIGQELVPMIGSIAVVLRDDVIPALSDGVDAFESFSANSKREIDEIGLWLRYAGDFWTPWDGSLTLSEMKTKIATENMAGDIKNMASTARPPIVELTASLSGQFDSATTRATASVRKMVADVAASLLSGQDDVESAAKKLADASTDPIAGPARVAALAKILRGEGSVGKQLAAGLFSSDPLVSEAAHKLQQSILSQLGNLNIKIGIDTGGDRITGPNFSGTRARGGPVWPGGTFLVGEQGPELLHMGSNSGTITPNAATGATTVNINIASMSGVNDPRAFLQELKREVDRQGLSLVAS